MNKANAFKKAESNGHAMGPVTNTKGLKGFGISRCKICHMAIHILPTGNCSGMAITNRCYNKEYRDRR